ncbi:MAG: hypothetical protein AAB425_04800, partial [Bdellovibrionota bacterium]
SARETLDLAFYLTGHEAMPPVFPSMEYQDLDQDALVAARSHFRDLGSEARVVAYLPLFDESSGILSDVATRNALMDRILGTKKDLSIARRLFEAYLDQLPIGERKSVLAHILSTFVDGREESASLRTLLESMGPFGIKAGQFLRTSGLLPPNERAQLDHFLSQAAPPHRGEIMDALQRAFGKFHEAPETELLDVGNLIGSGSMNYVVRAKIRDSRSGEPLEVVVRILKEGVEGKIGNENAIWERLLARAKKDGDPDYRRLAILIEEARSHAWESLKPGGIELDLERERKLYWVATAAYANHADPATGLSVHVTRPLDEVAQRRLIDPKLGKVVSIYHYVPNTPLAQIEPP